MKPKLTIWLFAVAGALALTQPVHAQRYLCEPSFRLDEAMHSSRFDSPAPTAVAQPDSDPIKLRILKYAAVEMKHRLNGLASYYSTSLDGTLTANGEHYHNKKMSAAHLTLPLGSWVEVTARATGKKLRLRVNDRGPYVNKFVIDLSQAAARFLGVDIAEDRSVLIRLIALPGENPLPEDVIDGPKPAIMETAAALTPANR